MFESFYEGIVNLVTKLLVYVTSLLPRSPFAAFIESFETPSYMGWLNWLIPVPTLLQITLLWLGAISAYYLISIVARWIKVIGS